MSEKISYVIFFVVAMVIVSIAVYIERPESLASAIPGLAPDENVDSGDSADEEADTTEADSGDSADEEADTIDMTPEEPQGDGDGETDDDVNSTQPEPDEP